MDDFTFPQETDGFTDLWVFYKAQDIVVGGSCFLFCCDLVKTTVAENLENALFFLVQAVSCCDCTRTKIERNEDKTSYPT